MLIPSLSYLITSGASFNELISDSKQSLHILWAFPDGGFYWCNSISFYSFCIFPIYTEVFKSNRIFINLVYTSQASIPN